MAGQLNYSALGSFSGRVGCVDCMYVAGVHTDNGNMHWILDMWACS